MKSSVSSPHFKSRWHQCRSSSNATSPDSTLQPQACPFTHQCFSNRWNLMVLLLDTWHKHFNFSVDLHCWQNARWTTTSLLPEINKEIILRVCTCVCAHVCVHVCVFVRVCVCMCMHCSVCNSVGWNTSQYCTLPQESRFRKHSGTKLWCLCFTFYIIHFI